MLTSAIMIWFSINFTFFLFFCSILSRLSQAPMENKGSTIAVALQARVCVCCYAFQVGVRNLVSDCKIFCGLPLQLSGQLCLCFVLLFARPELLMLLSSAGDFRFPVV